MVDLAKFLQLPRTPSGHTVIGLMTEPAMKGADGSDQGFLSLVGRGANQRTYKVTKADDANPLAGPGRGATETAPPLASPFWMRWLGSLFGAPEYTQKGDPVTFDAAITAEKLSRARWESTDALWEVIGNVLATPTITDKAGAIAQALDQFRAHVLGLVQASLAMKAEERTSLGLALAASRSLATKAGRVLSAGNHGKIAAAVESLKGAVAALDQLLADATPAPSGPDENTHAGSATLARKEAEMNANEVEVLAVRASERAVTVAKGLGVTDPGLLIKHGTDAYAAVVRAASDAPSAAGALTAKVAPSGAPQPAMPTDQVDKLIAQANGGDRPMGEPMTAIMQALSNLPSMAQKLDKIATELGSLRTEVHGDGAQNPGMVGVVAKVLELQGGIAERVAKFAQTPAEPRNAGDSPPPPAGGQMVQKGAVDWSGSAFGNFGG